LECSGNPLSVITVGWRSPNEVPLYDIPASYALSSSFSSYYLSTLLYVPVGSVSAYRADAGWNSFKVILEVGTPVPDPVEPVYSLSVSPVSVTFSSSADTQKIIISSNVSWEILISSASPDTVTGVTELAEAAEVPITTVTELAEVPVTVVKASPVATRYILPCHAELVSASPVEIDVIEDVSWLTSSALSGVGDSVIYLSSVLNPLSAARAATVTISVSNAVPSVSVHVFQSGAVIDPVSISLSLSATTLLLGDSIDLYAEVLPLSATNKGVVWSSSDSSVARVVDGHVLARSLGKCRYVR
jgi:hypothetical protein